MSVVIPRCGAYQTGYSTARRVALRSYPSELPNNRGLRIAARHRFWGVERQDGAEKEGETGVSGSRPSVLDGAAPQRVAGRRADTAAGDADAGEPSGAPCFERVRPGPEKRAAAAVQRVMKEVVHCVEEKYSDLGDGGVSVGYGCYDGYDGGFG